MKEMNARVENIQTASSISDVQHSNCMAIEVESSDTTQVRRSPKHKISTRDMSHLAGMLDFALQQTLSKSDLEVQCVYLRLLCFYQT